MNTTQQQVKSVEDQVKSLASSALNARVPAVLVVDSFKSEVVHEAERKGMDKLAQIRDIGFGDKHLKNLKNKGPVSITSSQYKVTDYLDDAAIRVIDKIGSTSFSKMKLGYELQENGARFTEEELDLVIKRLIKKGQIAKKRGREFSGDYERVKNAPNWIFREPQTLEGRADKIRTAKDVVTKTSMIEIRQIPFKLSYSSYKELVRKITPGEDDVIKPLDRINELRGKGGRRKPTFYLFSTISKYGSDSNEASANLFDAIYNYGLDFDETYVRRTTSDDLSQVKIRQFMDNDYPDIFKSVQSVIKNHERKDASVNDKTDYVFTLSTFVDHDKSSKKQTTK